MRSNALRQLAAGRHPEIRFEADTADNIEKSRDGYRLTGTLQIRGKTRPQVIALRTDDLGDAWRLSTEAVVRQSEFGVKPYSLLMGSLKLPTTSPWLSPRSGPKTPDQGVHMRIGVVFPQTEIGADAGAVRAYGEHVEGLGFAHLLAYDHVVGADPKIHVGWNGFYDLHDTFHEPLVTFGYLAAVTTSWSW